MSFYDRSKCCGAPIATIEEDFLTDIKTVKCSDCGKIYEQKDGDRFDAEQPDDQPHYRRSDY